MGIVHLACEDERVEACNALILLLLHALAFDELLNYRRCVQNNGVARTLKKLRT